MVEESKYYVFYDGDCGFCNRWVRWILKHDRKAVFRFASLQSDFGRSFLKERGLEMNHLDTLYLWKPKAFYLKKSQAVSKIALLLGGRYALLSRLNVFPVMVGDWLYDRIAERRKSLGSTICLNLSPEERERFLDNVKE
ncbi:thiol-disulfide oxidoreductase DCC family protein [Bergeyella sp. RCAD1439]|uniref:thiol-disulfide oxidoreductase DCC family protein n=1 Tax=Bergeyella anatis TaxID=3113737 RepID=UPI002E186DA7|nr:DCC1-like thiol-disulfide oxidoreductase family protein [Bergeyella sp. RCAD1439]